jgi:hypothetical protein
LHDCHITPDCLFNCLTVVNFIHVYLLWCVEDFYKRRESIKEKMKISSALERNFDAEILSNWLKKML